MGTPNYGPMQDFMDRVGNAGRKVRDVVTVPVDALQKMLGMNQSPPPPPDDRIEQANQSFRVPMATPQNPVVAPPRRKSMSGGEL